jgi:hypothetical protein
MRTDTILLLTFATTILACGSSPSPQSGYQADAGVSSDLYAPGDLLTSADVSVAVSDGPMLQPDGAQGVEAGGTIAPWAEWPMPNCQSDVTAGAPNLASYTDNGDGTVTDNVTKLMWQQVVPTTKYAWDAAKAYCPTLTLAGHSDWRLPSIIELVSIVDLDPNPTSGPGINPTYFPSTPVGNTWSSTPSAASSSDAWYVYFANGGVGGPGAVGMSYKSNVRCVR